MTTPEDLVARTRALIETVRTTDFTEATESGVDLDALMGDVDAINAALAPHVVHDEVRMQAALRLSDFGSLQPGDLPDVSGIDPSEIFPYSPVTGPLNPIAPPFRFWKDGEQIRGAGSFGSAYNGPPTAVHGGHLAALMDELLGVTGVLTGNRGFTGTLTVRYERLTPLETDLELVAWVDRTEGRKIFLAGELLVEGARSVFAEGVFIRPEGR